MPATPAEVPGGGGPIRRGRLAVGAPGPPTGEEFRVLHEAAGVRIEEIVSSAAVDPVEYDQDHDEWVVVLDGAARLTVSDPSGDGDRDVDLDLDAGDWVLLPAHRRHTVRRTSPGTRWLAVHLPPPPADPAGSPTG